MILTRVVMKTVMLIEIRTNVVYTQNVLNHSVRSYARWAHRRPSKVYFEDSEKEDVEGTSESCVKPTYSKKEIAQPALQVTSKTFNKNIGIYSTTKSTEDESTTESNVDKTCEEISIMGTDGSTVKGTEYTTLGKQDTTLSRLMLKVKSRKTREKHGLMVLEGKRLNQDALLAGLIPESLFFSQKSHIKSLQMPADSIKLYKVPYKQLQLWSDLTTSPGLMGFYKISTAAKTKPSENSLPLTVICDNVREPGNMGAIIRVTAGAGCRKILLTKGCVDVWDSKVLRAGVGAHFRIPIEQDVEWNYIKQHLDKNSNIFIADSTEDIEETGSNEIRNAIPLVPYYSIRYGELSSLVVVIGGETEGISQEALFLARYLNGARINIPLANSVESLNSGSALSVILFEIKRQLTLHNSNVLCMTESN